MATDVQVFTTVYGHGLLEELRDISAPKTVLVTMKDLYEMMGKMIDPTGDLFVVYFVESLEADVLRKDLEKLEAASKIRTIIGFGGGQALDVAKFFSWSLGGIALYQVPTALTVDAPYGHRAAIRYDGVVRYVGFATPLCVFIDYDIIRSAPIKLNLSGVADVLCYHTAHADWALATKEGKHGKWPYDEEKVRRPEPFSTGCCFILRTVEI